jgi:hypothetical protein
MSFENIKPGYMRSCGYERKSYYEIRQEKYRNIKVTIVNDIDGSDADGDNKLVIEYDPNNHYWSNLFGAGNYYAIFEDGKNIIREKENREITLYDYHVIYSRLLEVLYAHIISDGGFYLTENKKIFISEDVTDITYEDILYAYEKEKSKLDKIFNEFASRVENTKIEVFQERLDKINALISDLLAHNKTVEDKLEKIDNDIESMKTVTEYDKALEKEGYIDSDLNAYEFAPNIAYFLLVNYGIETLKPKLLTRYKKNGMPFKMNTAIEAIKDAKKRIKEDELKKQKKSWLCFRYILDMLRYILDMF